MVRQYRQQVLGEVRVPWLILLAAHAGSGLYINAPEVRRGGKTWGVPQ